MSNNLTVSEAQNIQSPPGNSLAIFLDKNGTLQAKDVRGNVIPLSNYLPSGGGGTPTLPTVYVGSISDVSGSTSIPLLFDNFNLTVSEGTLPILFLTGSASRGTQATVKRYLWKLGAGEFNPVGGTDLDTKIELIEETFTSSDDIIQILNSSTAQEAPLGVISEDFISYMNTHGPYVFTDVNKTYVVTFTKDDIDYAYIFQGALGTYGLGNLQFVPNDFIFIYQSTNAGEPTNSTYIRITRAEALVLQATASFVPGAIYVITDADVNLYGGTEITLTAITSSQLSLQGSGKFYCPKYDVSAESTGYGIWTKQMEGTFSNIVGTFTQNETVTTNNGATATYLAEGFLYFMSGDWSSSTSILGDSSSATADVSGFVSPSYTIGQVRHWGGKSWTNVNGNIGASIDKYTLNAEWTEIPFNATDYNVYIDEIHYDFGNDMIIYRKDKYNNVVSGSHQVFVEFESPDGEGYGNPIKDFQWGCMQDDFNTDDYFYLGIQGNEVIDSYFETLNTLAKYIWLNKLNSKSYIFNNNVSIYSKLRSNILNNSGIESNNLGGSSISSNTLNSSYINSNILSNSSIQNNILSNSSIQNNNLGGSSISSNTLNSSYINSNTLSVNSSIQSNTLNNSYIYSNTLNSSYIYSNTLSGGSNISNNTLNGSSAIQYNNLSNSSNITNNTLLTNSYIETNSLENNSSILNNTLNANSSIINNALTNNSSIISNTFSVKVDNNILNVAYFNFLNIGANIRNCVFSNFNQAENAIDLTGGTIVTAFYKKNLFDREDGTPRLQYVNNSDVVVITDVNA